MRYLSPLSEHLLTILCNFSRFTLHFKDASENYTFTFCCLLKLRYCEKATKFEKNIPLVLTFTS